MILLKLRDLLYSRRAYRAVEDCDLMVTNTFWLPILAKKARKGKVYVHAARFPKGQMKLYSKAARIQTVSNAVRQEIESQTPQVGPLLSVVPNPVDLPNDPPRLGNRGQGDRKALLYTGRVHPEKGLDLLLEAFLKFKTQTSDGWTLRIVGPWRTDHGGGGEEYLNGLKSIASAQRACVEWVDPIFDKRKLAEEYDRADLFCYPSLADKGESFGVSPLEAMAHGCPVIVSDLACFRDFIEPDTNGIIFNHRAKDSVDQLASAIRTYAQDIELLNQFGLAGRETAKRFTYESVAQAYLDDFQATLAS